MRDMAILQRLGAKKTLQNLKLGFAKSDKSDILALEHKLKHKLKHVMEINMNHEHEQALEIRAKKHGWLVTKLPRLVYIIESKSASIRVEAPENGIAPWIIQGRKHKDFVGWIRSIVRIMNSAALANKKKQAKMKKSKRLLVAALANEGFLDRLERFILGNGVLVSGGSNRVVSKARRTHKGLRWTIPNWSMEVDTKTIAELCEGFERSRNEK